jgi:tetratricopeptide (TPR) repeat protein
VAIVGKLLAPQPERRYQHADAIVGDLEAFLSGGPTTAGLEHAHASQETVRLNPATGSSASTTARPVSTQTVPTEPLSRVEPTAASAPAPAAATPVAAAPARPGPAFRGLRIVGIALLILTISGEGLSLVRAQRLKQQIPLMEVAGLKQIKDRYAELGGFTPFGLGKASVSSPLVSRLLELADRPILEYRDGRVAEAQWQQALDTLDFATTVKPGSVDVASRRAYVQGQLARINKRSREAIRWYRESARLDPRSFDPYLGLATVFTYDTHDLEGLTAAVADAEKRGYKQGGRERAEFGDLYKFLADQERTDAAALTGQEKIDQLQRAAADYGKCVEYFDGLRLFNSEANLRACRKRLAEAQAQLPPPESPAAAITNDVLGIVGRVLRDKIHEATTPRPPE